MSLKNTSAHYGSVSKFFHWTVAILVICMLVFGYFMDDIPKDSQPFYFNLHKMTGLVILLLMLLRAGWTWINPKPMSLNSSSWERFLEKAVHLSLYIFVIAMPLAGWIGSSAAGRPPHLGDLKFQLPIAANKPLAHTAFDMHGLIAIILIVLVSLHALAAIYHHYFRRDDVLRRMLPTIRR